MIALSIRQPWAWLIVNGFKDVENRIWRTGYRGQFLIHAGATMTKADYQACILFIAGIARNRRVPAYDALKAECGGIVGHARLVDCVSHSTSPWFVGDFGFELADAQTLPFQPCKGRLQFFEVETTGETHAEIVKRKLLHPV